MEKIDNYEEFDAQVDRFLRHQMTADEEAAFKAQLAADPEKKERARVTALMIQSMQQQGLRQDQAIVSEIKEMTEAQFRKAVGLKPKVVKFQLRFIQYAAAACVAGLLCWGGIHYYGIHEMSSLGASEYMAYVSDLSDTEYMRGTADTEIISRLTALFANVKEDRDISATIKELEPIYRESSSEDSPYFDFQDDIAWNLAIAYLLDGDRTKPVPILEVMVARNRDYPEVSGPAQTLLDKIKAL